MKPHLPSRATIIKAASIAATIALSITTAISGTPITLVAHTSGHLRASSVGHKSVRGRSAEHLSHSITSRSSKTPKAIQTGVERDHAFTVNLEAGVAPLVKPTRSTIAGRPAPLSGPWQSVGTAGIRVAPAAGSKAGSQPLKFTVLSAAAAKKLGVSGLALKIQSDETAIGTTIALDVPDKTLNSIYGADFASRARWIVVGAGSDPPSLASEHVASTRSTVITPQIKSQSVVVAAAGAPVSSSGAGNFGVTPLNAASKWDVSAQTGDFNWSYPMRTPPAAQGPTPGIGLNYDSQSVDGETSASNNQTTSVGDGWTLAGPGYISRQYVSCSEDDGVGGAHTTMGDQCWKEDNATVSFGGHAGDLVKQSDGTWKQKEDDGTTYQHLVGTACSSHNNGTDDNDCWLVTTTDGTKYYFGLDYLPGWATGKAVTNSAWTVPVFGDDAGEPCHQSTLNASFCDQAWQWNLDYIVDVHGGAEAIYYSPETNHYQQYTTSTTKKIATYNRGGQVKELDYGFKDGDAFKANAPSGKVVYKYDPYGRCTDTSGTHCKTEATSGVVNAVATTPTTASYYPDVPFDQNCTSTTSCPNLLSPSFWTTAMLSTVTTSTLVGSAYQNVDVWTLHHSFPQGALTSQALWLTGVSHLGYSGTVSLAEPDTNFGGVPLENRVDHSPTDGETLLNRWRIATIQDPLGSITTVTYATPTCGATERTTIENSPSTNTSYCFPQWWTNSIVPPVATPTKDMFRKYVVSSVVSDPKTGGARDAAQVTSYSYGDAGWRYNDSPFTLSKYRTWSIFAGADTVTVTVGSSSDSLSQHKTQYWYYQGRDGSGPSSAPITASVTAAGTPSVPDAYWFAGRVRKSQTFDSSSGTSKVISTTVNTPWTSSSTAGDNLSRTTGDGATVVTEPTASGGTRSIATTTTHSTAANDYLPATVEVAHSDASTTCSTTSYAAPGNGISGLVSESQVVGTTCSGVAAAVYPRDAVSDTRNLYDASTVVGAAPTKGDLKETDVVDSYSGTTAATAHWRVKQSATYDTFGRILTSTDARGHTVTTGYTPASGATFGSGALTSTTVTQLVGTATWTTTSTLNPEWGALTSFVDQNSNRTDADYDALGRRTNVWLPDRPKASNTTSPSIAYNYFLSQTAATAVETLTMSVNGAIPAWSLYDGLGRVVQTQALSNASGANISDTAFDSVGNAWDSNTTYWTSSVSPSATLFVPVSQSSIPSESRKTFDGAGRILSSSLYSYGTQVLQTTNTYPGQDETDFTPAAGGTPTSTFVNSAGETTKSIQYLASIPDPLSTKETTTYGYDASGNKTSMTDPAGNQWTWSYDVLDRQIAASDPDTGSSASTYDVAGNMVSHTDGNLKTIAYKYDELNRKTAAYKGADYSGPLIASWTYDQATLPNSSVVTDKGQLIGSARYIGSAAYQSFATGFDSLDRPIGKTVYIPTGAPAFGGTSYTTSTHYNAGGSVSSIALPAEGNLAAETLNYSYNDLGQVRKESSANLTVNIGYSPIGQLAQIDRLGTHELLSTYSYDIATGYETQIANQKYDTGQPAVNLQTTAYGYNLAGDVTSEKSTSDLAATDAQCFAYDQLQNLSEAWTPSSSDCAATRSSTALGGTAPYWTSYSIDPVTADRSSTVEHAVGSGGDKTDNYMYPAIGTSPIHGVRSVSHSGGSGAPTDTYKYDAMGNTIQRPDRAVAGVDEVLHYDDDEKLDLVTAGSVTESNVYDADGNLLLQTNSTSGSTLYLEGTELHLAVGDIQASATRTYMVGSAPVAERTTIVGSSTVALEWLGGDSQNTIGLAVDASTGSVQTRQHDPFGNSRGASLPWTDSHGFLNAPASPNTGLTQLGSRYYDSSIGRFLTVDPVLDSPSPSQNEGYAYAQNSPITMSDPSGNTCIGPIIPEAQNRKCYTSTQTSYKSTSDSSPSAPGQKAATSTLKKVSDFSYQMLVKWTASQDSESYVAIGNSDPTLLNSQLAYAIDAKSGNWWSYVPLGAQFLTAWDDGGEVAAMGLGLNSHFKTNGDWDLKVPIFKKFGLSGGDWAGPDGSTQVRADVFGNVNFGAMMALYGVSEDIALRSSHLNNSDAGNPDPKDDVAIKIGYQMVNQYPGGMTSNQYLAMILKSGPGPTIRIEGQR